MLDIRTIFMVIFTEYLSFNLSLLGIGIPRILWVYFQTLYMRKLKDNANTSFAVIFDSVLALSRSIKLFCIVLINPPEIETELTRKPPSTTRVFRATVNMQ